MNSSEREKDKTNAYNYVIAFQNNLLEVGKQCLGRPCPVIFLVTLHICYRRKMLIRATSSRLTENSVQQPMTIPNLNIT